MLDFFEALAAAGAAGGVVGVVDGGAVVRFDHLLGEDDGAVHGSIGPVCDAFGIAESPTRVKDCGDVPCISSHTSEAVLR